MPSSLTLAMHSKKLTERTPWQKSPRGHLTRKGLEDKACRALPLLLPPKSSKRSMQSLLEMGPRKTQDQSATWYSPKLRGKKLGHGLRRSRNHLRRTTIAPPSCILHSIVLERKSWATSEEEVIPSQPRLV